MSALACSGDDPAPSGDDPAPSGDEATRPLEPWQWVYEGFERDFLDEDAQNVHGWQTEGRDGLDIHHDAGDTHDGGANNGYLEASARESDVSMLKLGGVHGGHLVEAATDFYLNVVELAAGADAEFSVVALRDANGEGLGFVRLLIVDGGYELALRANGEDSLERVGLAVDNWYHVVLSYDAAAELKVNLAVDDASGIPVGALALDTVSSGIESFQYGKVSYEEASGVLLLDDVSIRVPAVRDLWVSSAGDDAASGTTEEEPLRTLQRGVSLAGPGTTVHVLPGTYPERVEWSYRGENPDALPLTLRGEGDSPDEVLIDGTGLDLDGWGGVVHVADTRHIALEALSVAHSESAGVFVQRSEDVTIRQLKTQSTQMSGVYVEESTGIVLEGVEVDRACLLESEEIAAQENISLRTVSDFEVRDCAVHGGPGNPNGGEGIVVKGYSSHGLIYRNRVYDLPDDVGIYLGVGSIDDGSVSTHHILVYQNDVSADAGIALSSEFGGTIEDIDIFNNVVHDGLYGGIQITKWQEEQGRAGAIGMRRRIRVFNNTVYNVGSGGVGGGIHVQCDDPAHIEDISIWNNIVSDNHAGQLVVPDAVLGVVTLSHNLLYGDGGLSADSPHCTDCISAEPRFVGTGGDPFELGENSPAIDAGTSAEVDLDFDGTASPLAFDAQGDPRPVGAYDIGAYESPRTD